MRSVDQVCRLASDLRGQGRHLVAAMIVASLCAVAGAQIDKTETDLHGAQKVYGLYAPTTPVPYINEGAITLRAMGATDPNASFFAYGLFTDVSLINSGVLYVAGIGGTADSNALTVAPNADSTAYGLYSTSGLIANSGSVEVLAGGGFASGGTPSAELGEAEDKTSASAVAQGVYSTDGAIENTAEVFVSAVAHDATGDTSDTWTKVYATARAYGLHIGYDPEMSGEGRYVTNSGNITIDARGGNVEGASSDVGASAWGYGIAPDVAPVSNSGRIMVDVYGGQATSTSGVVDSGVYAKAWAYGITSEKADLTNSNSVLSVALGGTAAGNGTARAYSDAEATAIHAGAGPYDEGIVVQNTGEIDAYAEGGTVLSTSDVASATANAYGLVTHHGDAYNTGDIEVTARGGHGTASKSVAVSAIGSGMSGSGGNLHNTGDVTVAATAGTGMSSDSMSGMADASATGIGAFNAYLDNSGDLTVDARGGSIIGSDALTWASVLAIHGINAIITNSGDVTATGTGGTATGIAGISDANALVYGFSVSEGNVNNSGAVNVNATGGTASQELSFAGAEGLAYGIYTSNGVIANSGPVHVAATGGSASSQASGLTENASAFARAYGLYAATGEIQNTGEIDVTAHGGEVLTDSDANAAAIAYGMLTFSGAASNSGDVAVTALGGTANILSRASGVAYATGFYGAGNFDNTGDITVTALGGTPTSTGASDIVHAYGYTSALGIRAQGIVNNSGSVRVTATGAVATADSSRPSADIDAFANAYAQGIWVPEGLNQGGVNNSGPVTVAATGGTATGGTASAGATAYGLVAPWTVNNSSPVTVTATGGTATGEYADAQVQALGLTGYVHNSGPVMVVATGGTAISDGVANVSALAQGITAANNTGTVSVTATAGTGSGSDVRGDAYAAGISTGDSITNSGDITVVATALAGSASQAYGIRMNSSANVMNTGVIRVTGDTAYELYVAEGTTRLFNTYNVTLDGDPNRASFGIADGATLALNDALLTVTAIEGQTRWSTPYKLFETTGSGAVDGNFAAVQPVNPNTRALYDDQGTAGSADDTVALAYAPTASPMLASAEVEKQVIFQGGQVVNNHMTGALLQNILNPTSSGLLANAGPTAESLALANEAPDRTTGVFVEPYYSRIDRDADPLGFGANLWGFSAGGERYIENTLLSLHAGYGQADIDYTGHGYFGNSEEQDIVTGGLAGLTRWDPWTLRYGVTGFYGQHDYEGLTGLGLDQRETASYDSYGAVTTLMAGYILQWNQHVFLPEAGVNWLWSHRQSYTTDATDPAWDTAYSRIDDHDLQAVAALRWLSNFMWNETRVTPSMSIGIRHLLTDASTSVVQSIDGAAPVLVKSAQDRTAMTLGGSLTLTRMPHAVSLAYDGDYSPDAERHSIWLRYSYLF